MLRAGSYGHWGAAGASGGGGGAANGPAGQSPRSISFSAAPAALLQWAAAGSSAPQQQPVGRVMDATAVTVFDEVGGAPAFVVPTRVVSTELAAPGPDAGHCEGQGQGQQREQGAVGDMSLGPGGFGGVGFGN